MEVTVKTVKLTKSLFSQITYAKLHELFECDCIGWVNNKGSFFLLKLKNGQYRVFDRALWFSRGDDLAYKTNRGMAFIRDKENERGEDFYKRCEKLLSLWFESADQVYL